MMFVFIVVVVAVAVTVVVVAVAVTFYAACYCVPFFACASLHRWQHKIVYSFRTEYE